jgi:hypothetical protein
MERSIALPRSLGILPVDADTAVDQLNVNEWPGDPDPSNRAREIGENIAERFARMPRRPRTCVAALQEVLLERLPPGRRYHVVDPDRNERTSELLSILAEASGLPYAIAVPLYGAYMKPEPVPPDLQAGVVLLSNRPGDDEEIFELGIPNTKLVRLRPRLGDEHHRKILLARNIGGKVFVVGHVPATSAYMSLKDGKRPHPNGHEWSSIRLRVQEVIHRELPSRYGNQAKVLCLDPWGFDPRVRAQGIRHFLGIPPGTPGMSVCTFEHLQPSWWPHDPRDVIVLIDGVTPDGYLDWSLQQLTLWLVRDDRSDHHSHVLSARRREKRVEPLAREVIEGEVIRVDDGPVSL